MAFAGLAAWQVSMRFDDFEHVALGIAAALMVLSGQLLLHRQKTKQRYLLDSVAAILVVAAAIYLPLHGKWIPFGWFLESQLVLVWALWKRESLFRHLAVALIALACLWTVAYEVDITDTVVILEQTVPRCCGLMLLLAAFCYLNGGVIHLRLRGEAGNELGTKEPALLSYLGSFCLGYVLWLACPKVAISVGWALTALVLLEVAFPHRSVHLLVQNGLLSLLSFGHLFVGNFGEEGAFAGVSLRLISVAVVVAVFVYAFLRLRADKTGLRVGGTGKVIERSLPWVAMISLVVLLYKELAGHLVPTGWAVLGCATLLCGIALDTRSLRVHSMLLFVACAYKAVVEALAGKAPGNLELAARVLCVSVPVLLAYACTAFSFR